MKLFTVESFSILTSALLGIYCMQGDQSLHGLGYVIMVGSIITAIVYWRYYE